MRSGVFHRMLSASGLVAILLSAQVSTADHLEIMRALADALPRQDELPKGSEWQQPKEQQQGNADSDLFVSRSWQGRKQLHRPGRPDRPQDNDSSYISCDITFRQSGTYYDSPEAYQKDMVGRKNLKYAAYAGLPGAVISYAENDNSFDKTIQWEFDCNIAFMKTPNCLVHVRVVTHAGKADLQPPFATRLAEAKAACRPECERLAKLVYARLPRDLSSKPKPDHRKLAADVLAKNFNFWIPPDLAGDEITAIHYKVNEHGGKTYVSYVVEWNRQRGEDLGHPFDYEPIVAVLDQNQNLEEVLYDRGHYEVGRLPARAFKDGKAQFWVSDWSHRYSPLVRHPDGPRPNPTLDTRQWDDPPRYQFKPLPNDEAARLLREWNDGRATLEQMNRNLSRVGNFAELGMGPDFLALDDAFDRPWEIGDVFGFSRVDRFGPFARSAIEVRRSRTLQAEKLRHLKIMTAPGATATIEFPDGSKIIVQPETVYLFEGLPDRPDRFGVGAMRLTSAATGPKGFPSEIRMLHGHVRTVQTDYEIVGDFKKNTVSVYKGSVELSDKARKQRVVVRAGERSTVEGAGPPSPPERFQAKPE